eukprot:UC1_evm2s1752
MTSYGAANSYQTIGALHAYKDAPCASSSIARTDGSCFVLTGTQLRSLSENGLVARQIIDSLITETQRHRPVSVTPMFQTNTTDKLNVLGISCAAVVESYYRSGMNSLINQALSGHKSDPFPNMHVQIPTRVSYIVGFKGLRHLIDKNVDVAGSGSPTLTGLTCAIAPGVIMTPISSVLEACNAEHANSEPLHKRWIRGISFRCLREVIFGVGLNQLSDYFNDRTRNYINHPFLSNMCGSLLAGVTSGYLSHVPHNLSTLKLLEPNKSYAHHFNSLAERSLSRVPPSIESSSQRLWMSRFLAVIAPVGVMVRTGQVIGSFIILNGLIYLSEDM